MRNISSFISYIIKMLKQVPIFFLLWSNKKKDAGSILWYPQCKRINHLDFVH